jgi:serine/threonine protein kinase
MDQLSQPQSPAALEGDLTGQVLGDFRVLRRLGEGGMGQVYLAEQISLKRKVALKVLRKDLAANSVSLARFKQEAENGARLNHANIVQVYFSGDANGLSYMALEYVEGRNLREYIEKKGPPDLPVALSIMRQVAAALQRACELGVVHRDIKPENILLTRKGEAKVADFGLSRCFDQNLHFTQTGVAMGTPLYMCPEQVEGKSVDHRGDIYSFGVTCYQMLAGQPPFRGESPFEVAYKHVKEEPPPLTSVRPDVPAPLCAMVHKMMAKRPEDRYQTTRDLLRDLAALRQVITGATLSPGATLAVGPVPPQPGDAVVTQAFATPTRKRWLSWAAGGSLVLALGGILAGLFSRRADPVPDRSESVTNHQSHEDREQELLRLVKEYSRPQNPSEVQAGVEFSLKLGFSIYLKERRLQEARRFFKELDTPGQTIFQYRLLGKLGEAIVFAFEDDPKMSMRMFEQVLNRKWEQVGRFWINTPLVREMIADALEHNRVNMSPGEFPDQLKQFLKPPQPRRIKQ